MLNEGGRGHAPPLFPDTDHLIFARDENLLFYYILLSHLGFMCHLTGISTDRDGSGVGTRHKKQWRICR